MRCFHPMCPADGRNNGALYRVNAKGQAAVWACAKHVQNTDAKVDPFVKELVGLLERNAMGKEAGK